MLQNFTRRFSRVTVDGKVLLSQVLASLRTSTLVRVVSVHLIAGAHCDMRWAGKMKKRMLPTKERGMIHVAVTSSDQQVASQEACPPKRNTGGTLLSQQHSVSETQYVSEAESNCCLDPTNQVAPGCSKPEPAAAPVVPLLPLHRRKTTWAQHA